MPLVTPALGNPYPTVNAVMNVARARVNDMMNSVDGDLLANDSVASQTYLSAAWRWLQGELATAGVETFIKDIILSGIPARFVNDTAFQSYISWTGCSDGTNQYEGPVLPQDMILPLSLWRRASQANGNGQNFYLMAQATDGLPTWLDSNVYDWRDDGLYFYGAGNAQDFRMRYSAYRPDLDITMPTNLVPMMMCEDCLGSRVAYEFANSRGAAQAPQMMQWAQTALETIIQRTSRRKQRQNIRRKGFNNRGRGYGVIPQPYNNY